MNETTPKKKHSLWWIWIIVLLVTFAAGTILGLKLSTMPMPAVFREKLMTQLGSAIPGLSDEPEASPVPTDAADPFLPPEESTAPEAAAVPDASDEQLIGLDAALAAALKYAKVEEKDAEVSGIERGRDADGKAIYTVDFKAGDASYHCVLDALSGEVQSFKAEGLHAEETETFGEAPTAEAPAASSDVKAE